MIDNDPECWLHEEPTPEIDRGGRGNVVRFVINTASSAAVRSKSHKNRCGAILALTQLLEMCDMHVQFEITTAIEVGRRRVEFRTVAKAAGEALNLATVSFWGSSQMEQHIDFSICETLPDCAGSWETDYGTPVGTSDAGDICFDNMHAAQDGVDWNSESSVWRYIVAQLGKQGIKLQK